MDLSIVLPRLDGADRRPDALEAENVRLRALLTQATTQADQERQRSRRLARIIEAASRLGAGYPTAAPRDASARQRPAGSAETHTRAGRRVPVQAPQVAADYLEVLDRDGCLITASADGPASLGAQDGAVVFGHRWIDVWTRPEDQAAAAGAVAAARSGRATRFQARTEGAGTIRWWDVAVTPIGETAGYPERIVAVSRDITELKLTEARQTLLMQELSHRMKNTLAMVQAVAMQTLRNADSLESAGEALAARLLALAQAHDVLLQGSFARASLSGLVAGAVSLHGDGVSGRFAVTGPDLTLGPQHGMILALMLHELGTNAAKYGALSVASGHVGITWTVAETAGCPMLRFRWQETGGPPVTPPTRSGFGTRLIARSLAHSFGGTAHLTYPPEGATLTFEAPLDTVLAA